jgi:uncharacterized protein with PIN domain
MKFVADGMLGKLVRWLRLTGHDVIYIKELGVGVEKEDAALVEKAKLEERILLTSDVELNKRARMADAKSFLVSGNDVVAQLVEISKLAGQKVEIDLEKSRCPICNGPLRTAEPQEVEGSVPAAVAKSHDQFWVCTSCGKAYWRGGHWKNIMALASRYGQVVNNAESE